MSSELQSGAGASGAQTESPLPLSYKGAATFSPAAHPLRRIFQIPEVGVLIPLILITIAFDFVNPHLLDRASVLSMLKAVAFVGIVGIGQTFLMIAGEIDLSVGSVAGLCAIFAGTLMHSYNWPIFPAVVAGIGLGGFAGLINGTLAVRVGLPAFIATLGMLYVARGVNYLICNGYPIYPIPAGLVHFGQATTLGFSTAFVCLILLALLGDIILRKTTIGRAVYATGGNREVAHIAGINTNLVKISCYILTGALAGTAGILSMAQFNSGTPETGTGMELDVIATVVVGGVSLLGGAGTVLGAFFGLLLMQIVRSGLSMSGAKTHWQTVAVGVIMILSASVDLLRRKTGRR